MYRVNPNRMKLANGERLGHFHPLSTRLLPLRLRPVARRRWELWTELTAQMANDGHARWGTPPALLYTRYCFVSGILCTNQYYSLRTHTLCLGTSPHSGIAHDIAQCNVSHRHPVTKYTTLLAVAVSCKGQHPLSTRPLPLRLRPAARRRALRGHVAQSAGTRCSPTRGTSGAWPPSPLKSRARRKCRRTPWAPSDARRAR